MVSGNALANRKRNPGLARTISRFAGRSPHCVRSISASPGSQTMKPRNLFGFGASFTLAAIYSRGTCRPTTIDVLMFHFRVRNGTGWDHQAMTTRLLPYFVLSTLYSVLQLVWLSSALAGCCCVCWLPVSAGSRLTSAWLRVLRFLVLHSPPYMRFKQKLLVTGVVYKVYWMLVVLGSIHYCNYTCTLSTWSSSTLL